MAKFQQSNRRALQPIPRVVDNTARLAIRQFILTSRHRPKKVSDMPGGAGTFAPYGNTNFNMPGTTPVA